MLHFFIFFPSEFPYIKVNSLASRRGRYKSAIWRTHRHNVPEAFRTQSIQMIYRTCEKCSVVNLSGVQKDQYCPELLVKSLYSFNESITLKDFFGYKASVVC